MFTASGLIGAKIHARRAVGAGICGRCRIALASGAGIALRSVEHRARLVVVNGEGPELPRRNVLGQRDLVGLAVEILAPGIDGLDEVLRAESVSRMIIAGVINV